MIFLFCFFVFVCVFWLVVCVVLFLLFVSIVVFSVVLDVSECCGFGIVWGELV